ncbi:MAG: carbon storage regulator CsrA [Cellvibrionaceae bacterium]
MLILTRKVGETIMVGDEVLIAYLGLNGHEARIGIEASKETPIHRREIWESIQNEKKKKIFILNQNEKID